MNAPTPHIGTTLAQRAILRYRLEQRELEAERERFERTAAALQVDALLDRVSQPEPCQFCAVEEQGPAASLWVWSLRVLISLELTFLAYELATRLLPALLQVSA
jgi:hypothetical protein